MKSTIGKLNAHYWISIAVLATGFLLALLNPDSRFAWFQPDLTVEMYAIAITLAAIPLALKLFAYRLRRIPKGTAPEEAARLYGKASLWRLYMVNVATLGNILLFAASGNRNFMWLTLVLFLVFLFCKPSYAELEGLVAAENEESPTA